jgi:O-antigen/teichoic acid export membrane protein
MRLGDKLRRLVAGGFLRDVAKLVSGTLGGRVILLAALPLVTRLYTPEDFALLAVYMALVSTIGAAACLRLEIAIPLAESEADAADLLVLALLTATAVALVLTAAALLAPGPLAAALGKPAMEPHLWLVPLGVLMLAGYTALQFWATRARRFGSIARTRVAQAGAGAATMLGLGWAGVAPLGLLLGNMLAMGAGGLRLGVEALARDGAALRGVTQGRLRTSLYRYRRYPLFSTPEALANIAALQVSVLMIAAAAGAEAGHLFLALQVMAAPMTLLGMSVAQVYSSRAAEERAAGRLGPFTRGLMRRLLWVGAGPILLGGLVSPWAFPAVFGAEWARAGEIAAWIAPWMLLQLIASPVSMALHVTDNQALALALQLFGLVLRVGAVAGALAVEPSLAVAALAVASAVFYGAYILTIAMSTQTNAKHLDHD